MLVSWSQHKPPNLRFYPTRNPNASKWNIGCVGYQRQNSGIGHVHFMSISCLFHVVCASFSALATQELADAKADSSGIQAKDSDLLSQ